MLLPTNCDDLFSETGVCDGALDAALLEKLQAVAEHLREAEGWEWCAGRMEPVVAVRMPEHTRLPEPEAVLTEAKKNAERTDAVTTRWKTSVRNPTCWKQK
ncbi:hypothetical protein ECP03047777_5130 [Escherichia coli P0304777.7]|nr:hypothetical protein ECP03047777_5130 [Escherichia coli P0304777.7]